MRDRVVESIQEIKKLSISRKSLFSPPDPKILSDLKLVTKDQYLKDGGYKIMNYFE